MTARNNYDVFLSFSSRDMDKVTPIADYLEEHNISVYKYDWEKPGEIWPNEIEAAIKGSKSYVCLLSANFLNDPRSWPMHELNMAIMRYLEPGSEFLILPVRTPEVAVNRIPLKLQPIRHIDYDPIKTPLEIVKQLRDGRQPDSQYSLAIAVFAMNRAEAEELFAPGFMVEEFGGEFSAFLAALRRRSHRLSSSTIKNSYGAIREDWIPAFCQESRPHSISGIIHDVINKVQHELSDESPSLKPYFVSDIAFPVANGHDFDHSHRTRLLYTLKRGAVLIVDAISLFHPHLRRVLLDTGLATQDNVSIVILYPFGLQNSQLYQELLPLVESKLHDARFRFSEKLMLDCELGIGDLDPLRRWLYTVLPQIPVRRAEARQENRNRMKEHQGSSTIGSQVFPS